VLVAFGSRLRSMAVKGVAAGGLLAAGAQLLAILGAEREPISRDRSSANSVASSIRPAAA